MTDVRRLTMEEAEKVYMEQMQDDFPEDELKPWPVIRRSMERGGYACYGRFSEQGLDAYAYFVMLNEEGKHLALLDFLAVQKQERDQGIGSTFLRELAAACLTDQDLVILEAEDPEYAATEAERETRVRRLHFYDRSGMVDTGVRYRTYGVPFVILEWPVHSLHDRESVVRAYESLYGSVVRGLYYPIIRCDRPE